MTQLLTTQVNTRDPIGSKNTWYHSGRRVRVLSFVTLLSLVTKILTCIFMCFKSEESEEDEFNITH